MALTYPPLCSLCHQRHTLDPSGICAACRKVKKIPSERIYANAQLRLRAALWVVELMSRDLPAEQVARELCITPAEVYVLYAWACDFAEEDEEDFDS